MVVKENGMAKITQIIVLVGMLAAPQLYAAQAQDIEKFFAAAQKNDTATLKQMIKAGFNVDTRMPKSGRTPLLEAASRVKKDAVNVLLGADADPNLYDTARMTPLLAVLRAYPTYRKAKDTFLIVGALLKAGANIDSQDIRGLTALMYAATYGLVSVVEQLVEAGADGTLENTVGDTAMDMFDRKSKLAKQIEALLFESEFSKIGNGK